MIGTHVRIMGGSYSESCGFVVREEGGKVVVELNDDGLMIEVPFARSEVAECEVTLDMLEARVLLAVGERGAFYQRGVDYLSAGSLSNGSQLSMKEFAQGLEALNAELELEREAAENEALTRFRAQFQMLDSAARTRKWFEERAQWQFYGKAPGGA